MAGLGARFVRVSSRGRWHAVKRMTAKGAFQTDCGRILAEVAVEERTTGAVAEAVVCEKCSRVPDARSD